jgi:hypothetical protein
MIQITCLIIELNLNFTMVFMIEQDKKDMKNIMKQKIIEIIKNEFKISTIVTIIIWSGKNKMKITKVKQLLIKKDKMVYQ